MFPSRSKIAWSEGQKPPIEQSVSTELPTLAEIDKLSTEAQEEATFIPLKEDNFSIHALQYLSSHPCVKSFDLSKGEYFLDQDTCESLNIEELLDFSLYEEVSIWKKILLEENIIDKGRQLMNNCLDQDISDIIDSLVSIDIVGSKQEAEQIINLVKKYITRWPQSVFLTPSSSNLALQLRKEKNIRVCEINETKRESQVALLSLAKHSILSTSITSYFLGIYSQGHSRIIRNEQFCSKYPRACPSYWVSPSQMLTFKMNDLIPPLDDELLEAIGKDGVGKNSKLYKLTKQDILYNRFSGFLSYTKGDFTSYPSNEIHACCETTSQWDQSWYGYPKCAEIGKRTCGVYKSSSKKQLYCKGGGKLCQCASRKSESLRWVWRGNTRGELPVLNGKEFCEALGTKTVYIVGDSTMQQLVAVLANEVLRQKGSCGNQFQIIESDNLMPIDGLDFPRIGERYASIDQILPKILKVSKGNAIVIMTAGHHINNFEFFTLMIKFVRKYVGEFKQKYSKEIEESGMKIFWKSQAGSHTNCSTYKGPLPTPKEAVTQVVREKSKYEYWNRYPSYDLLTLGYFHSSALDGFFDVSPLYSRPDAHAFDCTHYCVDRNQGTPLSDMLFLIYEALLDKKSENWLYQWE